VSDGGVSGTDVGHPKLPAGGKKPNSIKRTEDPSLPQFARTVLRGSRPGIARKQKRGRPVLGDASEREPRLKVSNGKAREIWDAGRNRECRTTIPG
jgi:hypothetical protein